MEETPAPQAPVGDGMPPHVRALFRSEALAHYRRRYQEAVAPPYMSSRSLALLWGALLFLLCGAAAVALALHRLLLAG